MLANIIVVAIIVLWTIFTIWHIYRELSSAKKSGIKAACVSCASFKAGNCSHSCVSETDVEKMILAAKKNLSKQK